MGRSSNPTSNTALPALLHSSGECTGPTVQKLRCQSPCFPKPVIAVNDSRACDALALSAINAGRRSEQLPTMGLPDDYRRLSPAEQLFVLVNLERIARRVPPLVGLTAALGAQAQLAATQSRDPELAPAYGSLEVALANGGELRAGGAWAGGDVNALEALFGLDVRRRLGRPRPHEQHRLHQPDGRGLLGASRRAARRVQRNRLRDVRGRDGLRGAHAAGFISSYVVLIADPAGAQPPLSFSWNDEVVPHLPPDERVRAAP